MMFFQRKTGKISKRAETILEVLVAIFVVALGSSAATSLVVDAMQANGLSRDNLIAMNLAVEGAEAVREIRDSNWLKFSYDRENCWNMQPDKPVCGATADLIDNGNYTPFLDTSTMGWKLELQTGTDLDLAEPGKKSGNLAYQLYITENSNLYVARSSSLPKTASRFYRMVNIDYPNTGNPANEKEMTVTSIVQWDFRGVHQVKLVTKLTDYLKIKRT
jgi:hypothetical protein